LRFCFTRSIVGDYLRSHFKDHNFAVASIFCNYKERAAQALENLIASLWIQIIHEPTVLSDDVKDLHNVHAKKGTRPTVDEISKLLQSEVSQYAKAFFVVDGLDECLDGRYQELLLTTLQSLHPNVNIMVTSRFLDTAALRFDSQLEICTDIADVQAYVDNRISREGLLRRHVQRDPALRGVIVNVVGEKCENL